MAMSLKERLKGLDNYRWALLIGAPIALGFLIAIIALGGLTAAELLPDWLVAIFTLSGFIGAFSAASGYFGRIIDGIVNKLTKNKAPHEINTPTLISTLSNTLSPNKPVQTKRIAPRIPSKEILFTIAGAAFGVIVAIVIAVTSALVPMSGILPFGLATALLAFNCVNVFGGLFNRVGASIGVFTRLFKKNHTPNTTPNVTTAVAPPPPRLDAERKAMLIAFLIGLAIAIALIATFSTGGIAVTGLTAFFTATTLPWLTGVLFGLSFTGLIVSAVDYFARAACYLKYLYSKGVANKEYVEGKPHEHRGALVGVALGITLGIISIIVLATTLPVLFTGIVGVIALSMVFIAACSILGGLGSRIGRLLDGFFNRNPRETNTDKCDTNPPGEPKNPSSFSMVLTASQATLSARSTSTNNPIVTITPATPTGNQTTSPLLSHSLLQAPRRKDTSNEEGARKTESNRPLPA